jgi:large subunit ribosomal protein L19
MRNKLIQSVEATYLKKAALAFDIGDTVSVGIRIREGNKTRIQPFVGVVIARHGAGTNETFTVRRIVNNEGVERIFPMHSPHIESVDVQRKGIVRRSKLFFLRDRVGKARKLRERRIRTHGEAEERTPAPAPTERTRRGAPAEEMAATV